MSIINEAAQWAVLLFTGIFVFGLTRQLGAFLSAGREGRVDVEGPRLGQTAPAALVTETERISVIDRMRETGADWVGVLVTRENCPGCEDMLSDLEEARAPRPPVLILATEDPGDGHRKRLERLGDFIVADERRLERLDIGSTPFCLILDHELRVVQKGIGVRLDVLESRWRGDEGSELQSATLVPASSNGSGDRNDSN